MPITPTYPGVYVEEIPSGVRTITGVSTSVTAFVGSAKRGPVNKAVHILSYGDYERIFGGLAGDSEMSYAVRQFFLNGGSDAWTVRIAKGATAAFRTLQNADGNNVLTVTALDEGQAGNAIEVSVDHQAANPASGFNLSVRYISAENPADNKSEAFANLSMNPNDVRFVEDVVNGASELISAKVVPGLTVAGSGVSLSGDLGDVATLVDASHSQFSVSVNGLQPVAIQIATPADLTGADVAARLASLCAAIQTKVRAAANGQSALSAFTCAPEGTKIKMTSGKPGADSSVRVLPGERNDATSRLKLGIGSGGTETDAAAAIRPKQIPEHGSLKSGVFAAGDLNSIPDATHTSLQISLDGQVPSTISIGDTAAVGANIGAKLGDIALRIQTAVRALKPTNPAYKDFTCAATADKELLLVSGTCGQGSSVMISPAKENSVAAELHLLTGATYVTPGNVTLQEGKEFSFTADEAYALYIADKSARKGLYALESVDLFNLLCLPGVTDSGILTDAAAYCQDRRAFLIVDAPRDADKPAEMAAVITGPALPKTKNAAVYYPWIKVADPLRNGRPRTSAPCGTIAGMMARIDTNRGIWKAPAGTEAVLSGVQGVEYQLTDPENGTLNPHGVNCIRIFPVYGPVSWGARTLRGDDQMADEWKYIPVRRLALHIEESLYRGTKWVVFEPNDEPLWAQIRLNVGAFMHGLFRKGAFQGQSPREAYFVKCDKETTTQNDINQGIVNILVGFAPLKPAEFVMIKIQQMAGQIEA